MLRTRRREFGSITGSTTRHDMDPPRTETKTRNNGFEICEDETFTRAKSDQFFSVSRRRVTGGICNGRGHWNSYSNYPLAHNLSLSHIPISGRPSNSVLAAELLAGTNPSRPSVDIPVFLGEISDIPKLLRLEGRSVAGLVSGINLNIQFGWGPLISDVRKMLSFQDAVDKRVRDLKKLQNGTYTRKRSLFEDSRTQTTSSFVLFSDRDIWRARRVRTTTLNVWGYAKWSLTEKLPETDAELRRLADRAVHGLYVNPAAAWELIPWSWLIDWFSNVGDILHAKRNLIPAQPTVVRICEHRQTTDNFTLTSKPSGAYADNIKRTLETKSRTAASASLQAYLPFLTGRQISILGSIGVLRRHRARSSPKL